MQYQIEQFAAGITDDRIPSTDAPAYSRLEKLKGYQNRWRTLKWRRTDTYPLLEGCPLYELHGGAFAQLWYPPLWTAPRQPHLNIFYLPSATRGREAVSKVSYASLGLDSVYELFIDPDQDLMVLIGGPITVPVANVFNRLLPIHVRCLSTNRQHPAANMGSWNCPIPGILTGSARLIPIVVGDLFALLFNSMDGNPGFVAIWRWTTGRLLIMMPTHPDASSFTFLTVDRFLMPVLSGGCCPYLELFEIPATLLDRTQELPTATKLTPYVRMNLPNTRHDMVSGGSVVCRSKPLPRGRQWQPPATGEMKGPYAVPKQAPEFRITESDRIVTCSWIYNVNRPDDFGHGIIAWQETHVMITHVSSLLDFMDKSRTQGPETMQINWYEWSHLARLLFDRCRRNWYSHTFGNRFVLPSFRPLNDLVSYRDSDDHDDEFSIVVLDFNIHGIRREMASWANETYEEDDLESFVEDDVREVSVPPDEIVDSTPPGQRNLRWSRTRIDSVIYETAPHSSLPYMETRSKVTHRHFEGLMMCEEHVLNLRRRPDRKLDLDVFSI